MGLFKVIYGGFRSHRGTPKSSSILVGGFFYKASILEIPHWRVICLIFQMRNRLEIWNRLRDFCFGGSEADPRICCRCNHGFRICDLGGWQVWQIFSMFFAPADEWECSVPWSRDFFQVTLVFHLAFEVCHVFIHSSNGASFPFLSWFFRPRFSMPKGPK